MTQERKAGKPRRTAAEELDADIGQSYEPAETAIPKQERTGFVAAVRRVARDALVRRTSTKR
jgi:hypothetical protein